jgi:hypothetical protein
MTTRAFFAGGGTGPQQSGTGQNWMENGVLLQVVMVDTVTSL